MSSFLERYLKEGRTVIVAEVNWGHGAMTDTILGNIAKLHNWWQYRSREDSERNVNELGKLFILCRKL